MSLAAAAPRAPSPACLTRHGCAAAANSRDSTHTKPALQALACNISTGAVGEENGAIELWPGSHLEQRSADLAESQLEGNDVPMLTGRLSNQQLHAGDIHPAIAEERRLSRPPLRCCTPKGSLLLRDMRLWHRGAVSAAPSPRPFSCDPLRAVGSPTHPSSRGSCWPSSSASAPHPPRGSTTAAISTSAPTT